MDNLTPEQLAAFKEKYGLVGKDEVTEAKEEIKAPEYTTHIEEYKGNKTLVIKLGESRLIGFGLKKAMAIESCIDQIRQFIDSAGE